MRPDVDGDQFCQPDGTFITSLEELGQWLHEMAEGRRVPAADGPIGR